MTSDESHLIDINAKPTYQASLRLACGATARVTVLDGEGLTDFRVDAGRLVSARTTGIEAEEIASMLNAADRNC